jgi:hypothetical protein
MFQSNKLPSCSVLKIEARQYVPLKWYVPTTHGITTKNTAVDIFNTENLKSHNYTHVHTIKYNAEHNKRKIRFISQ